ncbi:MAG: CooT family nickel-binding protein [Archaeoglobales archaeon]|nr:CooT family nickel-binding protein [Archaeoglobales archaeon]
MCESKVFFNEKILMEDVIKLFVDGEKVKILDILGNSKEVVAKIVEVDLVAHKIVLEGR